MSSLTQPMGKWGVLSYGLYQIYRKRFTRADWKCDAAVNFWKWQRICTKFNKRNMESIIKGKIFKMPYRLGSVGIIQFKRKIHFDSNGKLLTKGLVPDWEKTYKLWKELYPECKTRKEYKDIKGKQVIFRTNEHTDGRIFRFHWKKKYSNIRNISAYKLIISPQYKKALGRRIMENNNIQYCTKF